MKSKITFLTTALALAGLSIFVILKFSGIPFGDLFRGKEYRVKDYNMRGVCMALMPECGYCTGRVRDGECYLTQAEIDEYKKLHSNINVYK
jgi:hypothetical protein